MILFSYGKEIVLVCTINIIFLNIVSPQIIRYTHKNYPCLSKNTQETHKKLPSTLKKIPGIKPRVSGFNGSEISLHAIILKMQ